MTSDAAGFRFITDGIEHENGGSRLNLTITDGQLKNSVWYSSSDTVLSLRNEALLCLAGC